LSGFGVPKNTPAAVLKKLNKEINAALVDPQIITRFADLGGRALAGSPADFGKLIADETNKWAKVIRAANIKVEGANPWRRYSITCLPTAPTGPRGGGQER